MCGCATKSEILHQLLRTHCQSSKPQGKSHEKACIPSSRIRSDFQYSHSSVLEVQFQARQRRGPVVRGDNKVAELRKEYNRDPKILSSRETIDLLLGNLLQKVT